MVDFTGRLCSRTYVLELHALKTAPASVSRDGNALAMSSAATFAADSWYFDAASGTAWVTFRLDSSQGTTVTVQ
jgi:hypothetical protein